ncbi:MAG TPA: flagellar motor switch protein FliN [Bryobacteraceae bacterium]|jgi:flagellar motor switch protein FliN/FliY
MDAKRDATQSWLLKKLEERLISVYDAMAGVSPAVQQQAISAAPEEAGPVWRQNFQGLPGSLWISATEAVRTEAAQQVLRAAGLDDADAATLRSTYTETLGQALSGIAQDFSSRRGREITCAPPVDSTSPRVPVRWVRMTLSFPNGEVPLAIALDEQLLDALAEEDAVPLAALAAAAASQSSSSKTFDLLLDVELPVSVSFGRAQVALKDVIKLTTGSIVELNRSIAEPVEVIVNNCVIARGEVVVVEGNFGVRIQQVISRQERLRTLN